MKNQRKDARRKAKVQINPRLKVNISLNDRKPKTRRKVPAQLTKTKSQKKLRKINDDRLRMESVKRRAGVKWSSVFYIKTMLAFTSFQDSLSRLVWKSENAWLLSRFRWGDFLTGSDLTALSSNWWFDEADPSVILLRGSSSAKDVWLHCSNIPFTVRLSCDTCLWFCSALLRARSSCCCFIILASNSELVCI